MTIKTYILELSHDKGKATIQVTANSEEEAITRVMNVEGCPRRAITIKRYWEKTIRKPKTDNA